MKKRLKKIVRFMLYKKVMKVHSDMCKRHLEWENITKDEKLKINKRDIMPYKVYKNLYEHWDECQYWKFVSDGEYQTQILPRLNAINYDKIGFLHEDGYFLDKNYLDINLNRMKCPEVVLRKINGNFYDKEYKFLSREEALALLKGKGELVFKKSTVTGHGAGVKLIQENLFEETMDVWGDNLVIQKVIEQHDFFSNYNASSVNIVRITSLLWENQVYILGGVFRIGAPGSFCDHLGIEGKHPLVIGLDEHGKLDGVACDCDTGVLHKDVFGKQIQGQIPMYQKMLELVKHEHARFLRHGIIGWDLTVDKDNNIICVEYNADVPGIVQTQMVLGPVFSQKSFRGNILLDEIYEKNLDV